LLLKCYVQLDRPRAVSNSGSPFKPGLYEDVETGPAIRALPE
jgi:hypothetical protein